MKKIIFILIISITLFSCSENKFKIDVSDIPVKIEVKRFDQDLFAHSADSIQFYTTNLHKKYGTFFETFTLQLIQIGNPNDSAFNGRLGEFMFYCLSNGIYKQTHETFKDSKILNEQLTQGFKHFKYYFPKMMIPDVYTCISGFNVSVFTSDSILGISLDKYLGAENSFYEKLGYEKYQRAKMTKEMIIVDCMRAWANSIFINLEAENSLLSNMIYEGKIQYFLNAILPETEDTLKWGYTERQLKWAEKYEKNIWDYLVDEKLLFSTDNMNVKIFTGEAAFTTPLRNISAPRAGTWVGYKIVLSYMENNPEISLEKLMNNNNHQEIYNLSHYRP